MFRAPSTPKSRHAQSRVDTPARPSESSPPVAGGSSCISRERASRLPAGTSRSRAAVRRLAAGLLLVVAGLLGVSAAAQAQTTYVSNIGQTLGTRVFTNPSCGVYTGSGSGVSAFMLPPNQSAEFLRLRSSTLSGLCSRPTCQSMARQSRRNGCKPALLGTVVLGNPALTRRPKWKSRILSPVEAP